MIVNQVGYVAPRGAARLPAGKAGSRVETGRAAGTAPASAVSMPGLLGLQEAESEAVGDRDARRGAEEMLDALRELQKDLLAGGTGAGLARAGSLARTAGPAADPGLRALQQAVLLRVAVETARHAVNCGGTVTGE